MLADKKSDHRTGCPLEGQGLELEDTIAHWRRMGDEMYFKPPVNANDSMLITMSKRKMNTPIKANYMMEKSHIHSIISCWPRLLSFSMEWLQWDPKIVSLHREQNRCFQSKMAKKEQLKMLDEAFWEVRRMSLTCSVTHSDLATDPGS